MKHHQKNLEAATRSWQAVANGVGAIAAKQREILSAALKDMTEMVQFYQPGGSPLEVMAKQSELAKKTMEVTMANTCEITELMQKSGAEALKVVQDRFTAQVAEWPIDPRAVLADFVLRLLPPTLDAIDKSGLRSFIGEHVRVELERVEIAPLAAGLLSAVIENGRHQQLLNELLDALQRLLTNKDALEILRENIRAKLPALFNLYRGEPVVLNKIAASATSLIADLRTDPDHPLRAALDAYLTSLIERLRTSPELARRADTLKRDLLGRPELDNLAEGVWNNLRDFLVRDSRSEESQFRSHLEGDVGGQLASDTAVRDRPSIMRS